MAAKVNPITGMTAKEEREIERALRNTYGYYMMIAGQLPNRHKKTFEQRLEDECAKQWRDRQRAYADLSGLWRKQLPREMWEV